MSRMNKRMWFLHILYLTFIGIIAFLCLRSLSETVSINYSIQQETRDITYIPQQEVIIPTEEDRQKVRDAYNNFLETIGDIQTLKEEISQLYLEETEAKVCSKVWKKFNPLNEKYNQYMAELEEIQTSMQAFKEEYGQYLSYLKSIPAYAIFLRNEEYNTFKREVQPMYYAVEEEKDKYSADEQEVTEIYTQAEALAETIYKEYYDLMGHITNAEGGICPPMEQCYIMNVIENRIEDPRFANTLRGVIYSPGQYEPTWTGSINKTPSAKVWATVDEYLHGHVETEMPSNVVFQARFTQGKGIWKAMPSGHFFCYG